MPGRWSSNGLVATVFTRMMKSSSKRAVELEGGLGDGIPAEVLEHPLAALLPILVRSSGSLPRRLIAAASAAENAAASAGSKVPGLSVRSTSRPVSSGTTTSGMPPTLDATTAVSHAIASRLMMPNGS